MSPKGISEGTAHKVTADMRKALVSDKAALAVWESLTPLARNEWICWTISVQKSETREEHVTRMISQLHEGKRRPCCWMGCIHRKDKSISATQKWILEKQAKRAKRA